MRIDLFRPRVLAGDDDAPRDMQSRAAEHVSNFARLLRRATHAAHRPAAHPRSNAERRYVPDAAENAGPRADTPPSTLFQLDTPSSDYIQALVQHEAESAALCSVVAERVADFCAVPAVIAAGRWNLRIMLDPELLPDCALEMELSYLHLLLRFEAQSPGTRELLLRNMDTLRSRMLVLLARHALARDLEIVVW